jgi:hypothetical protein
MLSDDAWPASQQSNSFKPAAKKGKKKRMEKVQMTKKGKMNWLLLPPPEIEEAKEIDLRKVTPRTDSLTVPNVTALLSISLFLQNWVSSSLDLSAPPSLPSHSGHWTLSSTLIVLLFAEEKHFLLQP